MFTSEQLLRIFADKDVRSVPVGYQSILIHAIDRILDEMEREDINSDAKLSEPIL